MPLPKTGKEIEAEIKALENLKPLVPHYSYFGDDNWAKIDLEIRVLEEGMDEDMLNDYLDKEVDDEAITEEERCELASDAYNVVEWMEGQEVDDSPSGSWASCVQTPVKVKPVAKEKPCRKKTTKKGKKKR